ncbi:hypothetical protein PoMZ_01332 [Pyricularia oryzae]|uniref:Carbohydrate kinase PfkB domain-containing protein n=1 Tax=Pyricularia oryzae TaxID=318829 RepID=A0A4P7N6G0_PYROR|nr:hypothetical protein PoMZ_01332 [Pyricularia oryzae]
MANRILGTARFHQENTRLLRLVVPALLLITSGTFAQSKDQVCLGPPIELGIALQRHVGYITNTTGGCNQMLHSGLGGILKISDEVRDALESNRPVVALESTIYTHGAVARSELGLEDIVRQNGGTPAVIGVLAGVPTVGLTDAEVERMISEGANKVSRRDLAYLAGLGMTGRQIHGGTTIAGTMLLARLAGIKVFGTGGLGGVHRGWESTMDISADLTELGRTRVAVICSGSKGFLDIPTTLEYLETQGVLVSTFAEGRTGKVDFPAFWARESGIKSPSVINTEAEAAAIILAQEKLGIETGILFASPIPEQHQIPREEMDAVIKQAVSDAAEQGFTGSQNTPFILGQIRKLTDGRSVPANVALIKSNVERATKISVELSKLSGGSSETKIFPTSNTVKTQVDPKAGQKTAEKVETHSKVDVLVAGSIALDLSCDFVPGSASQTSPAMQTSNPSIVTQTVGGVGHNVALAAHRVDRNVKVRLCSLVGDDFAGATVLSKLESSGMDTSCIRQLGPEYPSARTAQYVAVNGADKNLVLAMADMGILTSHSFQKYWDSAIAASRPSWLVVDGNWSETDIHEGWIRSGRQHGAKIAFEPVSVAKSARLFPRLSSAARSNHDGLLHPSPLVDLATPNIHELAAMYNAAKEHGYFDDLSWFSMIDALGMRGARDRFVRLTSTALTDTGVPQQIIHLLPYIPSLLTKLGDKGVLLSMLLSPDDARVRSIEADPYILVRATGDHPHVGAVYMRLFPAAEDVQDVVSVNGVGDTFCGTLIAGLARGAKVENLIDVAQKAAVLTLRSHQSVSDEVGKLEPELARIARLHIPVLSQSDSGEPLYLTDEMGPKNRNNFESSDDDDFSNDEFASFDDDNGGSEVNFQVRDKDSDEEELERLVLGDTTTFRSRLFEDDDFLPAQTGSKDLQLAQDQSLKATGNEAIDDSALFFFATEKEPVTGSQQLAITPSGNKSSDPTAGNDVPAWEDSDDEKLSISLAGASRLRKLRLTEGEDIVSGAEYSRRLRQQYLRLNPQPSWVKDAAAREPKRRRRSSASSGSDSGSGSDDEDFGTAMPLEEFLRDVSALTDGGSRKRRKLRPETINIQKTRDIPDVHKGPVESLSFHPQHPVLLSSSTSSMLHLHHISPAAHPTPNPLLTSVQVQNTPIRKAEFLSPSGEQIVFAGRRRFFHSWNISTGQVTKVSRIHGHRLEQKSVERFKLSPCGRYMAIVGTDKKGGGLLNIMRVGTMQWIAQARMDGRHGIADFCWWRTGEGMTTLGRDGQVGEWNLEAKRFFGIWRDSGSTGGTVLALGGRDGPSELGEDRWVAVGSNVGILQVYDRDDLVLRPGVGQEDEVTVKETPEPTRAFESLTTAISVVTFSPDAQLLAFGSIHKKDALRLAHIPSCTLYRNWPTSETPFGRITAVAFGMQSDLIAVGNDKGKIRLWEIRS